MNPYLILQRNDFVFFTTREFALKRGSSLSAASHQLKRFASEGLIIALTRGVWANPHHPGFSPLGATHYLLGRAQGYVSFLTALHLHGILSQIPTTLHIATSGYPRRVDTPIGFFELHQLHPSLMREGITWSQTKSPYRMATPEKALFDTLYLSIRKGNRFQVLPELELTSDLFQEKNFWKLLSTLRHKTLQQTIKRRYEKLTA